MKDDFDLYVGIDWGETACQVCLLDPEGAQLGERVVEHSGKALTKFFDELARLSGGRPERVAVAIEVPHGAMVEGLIERGFGVFAVNPKQLDRFRDRHTVAGSKDDRRDAYVLADSLRTDRPLFRRLKPEDPLLLQLREMSRLREDLVEQLRRLCNQLRQQLHRYYPQVLSLSPAADDTWVWDLLELAPTPASTERLSRVRVQKVLRTHRIRRLSVEEVLTILRAPALPVAPGVVPAASGHIRVLLDQLRLIHRQRRQCDRDLGALLDQIQSDGEKPEHRGVAILLSLPGIGRALRSLADHLLRILSAMIRSGTTYQPQARQALSAA